MRNEYSTFDIVKTLKIQREKLKDWMTQGFIKPSIPAPGQGRKAIFTLLDVYGIGLFARLIEFGFKRHLAAEFIHSFIAQQWRAERTEYILFRCIRQDEGYGIQVSTFEQGEAISLETGGLAILSELSEFQDEQLKRASGDKNWVTMVIINFSKLREDIDNLLKDL